MAYSHLGELWACGDIDGVVNLYKFNPEGAELLKEFEDHGRPIRDVAFSQDDSNLLSVSDDNHINLTDINAQKRILSFTGHQLEILWWCFHPSGKLFVTGSADKTVKIWDISSQVCTETLKMHNGTVWDLRFSPDGRYLISGGDDGILAVSEFR